MGVINPRVITYLAGAGAGAGGVLGDGTHGQGQERGDDDGDTHVGGVDLGNRNSTWRKRKVTASKASVGGILIKWEMVV